MKIITSESGGIYSMRYIEQFKMLVAGSLLNTNLTIWSVPDFNVINKTIT